MSRFSPLPLSLYTAVSVMVAIVIFPQTSSALGFKKKSPSTTDAHSTKQIQTYQPPPANSLIVRCDPIKQKIILLTHKPLLLKPFVLPQRQWLISRHVKCIDRVMDQEYIYLKHVDIQQAPSLPKMAMPLEMVPDDSQTNQQKGTQDNEDKALPASGGVNNLPSTTPLQKALPQPAEQR